MSNKVNKKQKMKTVFIPIFHALQSRNILRTDVLRILAMYEEVRIILLVPEVKADYYSKNFSQTNVFIEPIPNFKENWLVSFIRLSANMLLDTGSMYWRARIKLENNKNYTEYLYSRFLAKIGHFKSIRDITRYLFCKIVKPDIFFEYFTKYDPVLVFLPDIYSTEDVYLGLEARRKNIFTVGMVRSWDNITSKGTCLFLPDKLIVHNEELKKQAIEILGLKPTGIEVTGLPHFDYYYGYKPTPREDFLKKLSLPINCRYLLHVPYLGTYKQSVNETLQIIDEAIKIGKLPTDLKIIVRMPPSYNAGFNDLWTSERIFIDYPGYKINQVGKSDWEFTDSDMVHFADSLIHASVILNFASTVTIDAAALDRPVINLSFDGFFKKDFSHSINDIYIVDHFINVLRSEGSPRVKNKEELFVTINNYLSNSNIDSVGRNKIVSDQCFRLDGRAGERVANYLQEILKILK